MMLHRTEDEPLSEYLHTPIRVIAHFRTFVATELCLAVAVFSGMGLFYNGWGVLRKRFLHHLSIRGGLPMLPPHQRLLIRPDFVFMGLILLDLRHVALTTGCIRFAAALECRGDLDDVPTI
jgi:hypothetical protein